MDIMDFKNFFALLLILPIIYLFNKNVNVNKRVKKFSMIIGLFSGLIFSLDTVIKRIYPIESGNLITLNRTFLFLILLLGFSSLFYHLYKLILNKIESFSFNKNNPKNNKLFIISFLVIIICWLPYFLYNFPGIVTVDSYYQIDQIEINVYSNWHPVSHTLFIKPFYELGKIIFKSSMGGIAVFSVVQMIIMALIFSGLINELHKKQVPQSICYIIAIYFALSPLHASFSITIWKDVLFGASALSLALCLLKLADHPNNNKYFIMFIIISLVFTLFRNNGIYAFIIFVPFLLIYFKKYLKKYLLASVLIISINFIITGPIYKSMNIVSSPITESLSIPLNQIARTIVKNGKISSKDKAYLEEIILVSEVPNVYNYSIADPIKNITNNQMIEENKLKFIQTWLNIMFHNFGTYIESFLLQNIGFWDPNVYNKPYATTKPFEPYSTIYNIKRKNLLPKSFDSILKNNKINDNVIMQLLYSPGLMFYLLAVSFIIVVYKKQKYWLLYIPFLAIWLTIMIATPVSIEARYVYALFTFMPLSVVLPFLKSNN